MRQSIANKRQRAGRMKTFFEENAASIAPNADITAAITDFNSVLTQFDDFAQKQQHPINYAQAKAEALQIVAELLSKWGERCFMKAEQSGNPPLATLLNRSVSDIVNMEGTEGLTLMNNMRDGLNNNLVLFSEQGLTALIITAIDDALAAYTLLFNKPKEAISARKTDTLALTEYMKFIDTGLKNIVTLLEGLWKIDHEDLVQDMKNNYRIDDLGHRFTGIQGSVEVPENVVADSGVPKYTITAELDESDYTVTAVNNILGEYKIQSMRPGNYLFKLVSPSGTVVKTAVIKIKRGDTLNYNWTV